MSLRLFKGFLDLHGLDLHDFKALYEFMKLLGLKARLFKGFLELLSLELQEFKAIYGLPGTSWP